MIIIICFYFLNISGNLVQVTASGFLTRIPYFLRPSWGELGSEWKKTQSWGAEVSGLWGVSASRSTGATATPWSKQPGLRCVIGHITGYLLLGAYGVGPMPWSLSTE